MNFVQQLIAAVEKVDSTDWVLVLLGVLLPIPFAYLPHGKQAFYQWRLDRRLARDPVIYQDELHDYEYNIGEDLDEVDWRAILWSGIGTGLVMASFFVLRKLDSEWAPQLILAVTAVGIGIGLWAHYRDAETKGDDPYAVPPTEYPPEAIWGLAGGVLFVFAIVMFALLIF